MNESDLKQRVLAAAHDEPSPPRDRATATELRRIAVALVVMLAIFLAASGVRIGERPLSLVAATALGAAALAVVIATLTLARGRSMLGRSSALSWSIALATPLVLLAWKLTWTMRFDVLGPTRIGLKCLSLSLAMATAPLLVLVAGRSRSDPLHPTATGAALGAVVGALAWVLVDLWCPVGYLRHVLIGHVLPLALLIAAGAALGWRFIAIRATSRT